MIQTYSNTFYIQFKTFNQIILISSCRCCTISATDGWPFHLSNERFPGRIATGGLATPCQQQIPLTSVDHQHWYRHVIYESMNPYNPLYTILYNIRLMSHQLYHYELFILFVSDMDSLWPKLLNHPKPKGSKVGQGAKGLAVSQAGHRPSSSSFPSALRSCSSRPGNLMGRVGTQWKTLKNHKDTREVWDMGWCWMQQIVISRYFKNSSYRLGCPGRGFERWRPTSSNMTVSSVSSVEVHFPNSSLSRARNSRWFGHPFRGSLSMRSGRFTHCRDSGSDFLIMLGGFIFGSIPSHKVNGNQWYRK